MLSNYFIDTKTMRIIKMPTNVCEFVYTVKRLILTSSTVRQEPRHQLAA